MDRFYKKWGVVLGLLTISASASVFMALEAGSFFQTLYSSDGSIPYMGYWAAALAEVFIAVAAGIWLPDIKKDKKNKIHPGNFLFKFLLVLLFLATAGGAGLNLIVPIMEKIESRENNERVIKLLESQVKDNENSLSMFLTRKQKLNSIVTIRNQLETKNELKKSFQERELILKLWIEASFIIFVRFVLQLANLSCVWLAGWVYRRPDVKTPATGEFREASKTSDLKCGDRPFALDDGYFKDKKTAEKNIIRLNRSAEFRPRYSPGKDFHGGGLKKPSWFFSKKRGNSRSKAEPFREEIISLRKKISGLLRLRNHNVSLAEVCGIIGEKESEIKNIVNLKVDMREEKLPGLKDTLKKIERLYSAERVERFGY